MPRSIRRGSGRSCAASRASRPRATRARAKWCRRWRPAHRRSAARASRSARAARARGGGPALALLVALVAVALWRARERPAIDATPAATASADAPHAARRRSPPASGARSSPCWDSRTPRAARTRPGSRPRWARCSRPSWPPASRSGSCRARSWRAPRWGSDSCRPTASPPTRSRTCGASSAPTTSWSAPTRRWAREAPASSAFDVRLQDAVRGETVTSVAETGAESALFEVVGRAGGKLRGRLGIGSVAPADGGGARAALPADPTAARLYAEGLERTRAGRLPRRARTARGGGADRARVPARPRRAGRGLGRVSATTSARATRPPARSPWPSDLPREGRLLVEARQAEASRDWARAIEAYGALFGFFPDNLEYGLRLARVQVNGGRAPDALGTVDTLRALPRRRGAIRGSTCSRPWARTRSATTGGAVRPPSAARRAPTRWARASSRPTRASRKGGPRSDSASRNARCRCSRRPAAPTERSGRRAGSHARSS